MMPKAARSAKTWNLVTCGSCDLFRRPFWPSKSSCFHQIEVFKGGIKLQPEVPHEFGELQNCRFVFKEVDLCLGEQENFLLSKKQNLHMYKRVRFVLRPSVRIQILCM